MHAHAFPDALAPRAVAALEKAAPWQAVGDGTAGGLIAAMDAADIDVAVACTIATRPRQAGGILRWCRKIRSDRVEPFPSVHPDASKADKHVAKIAEAGFVGIKLHPMYQDFAADEPRMDSIYAAASEAGLLVTLHCGRDIAYPPDDDRAAPRRIRAVIERHPSLRLLCTHLGGWQLWDEADRELIGRDVWLETSFALGERGVDAATAADMIRRHGIERVCFGSDWPWAAPARALELLGQCGLTRAERQRLLWSNAARLLGY